MSLDSEATFIFFGANEVVRNDDSHYPFRQESNFYYLTEFDEPGAALVLSRGESTLFLLDHDPEMETWTGERYGIERAKMVFNVDQTESIKKFYMKLDELLRGAKRVYFRLDGNVSQNMRVMEAIQRGSRHVGKGSHGALPVQDPSALVARMRMVKDDSELALMRKACSITARAHLHLLKTVRAGMTEFEACAEFQHFLYKNGCTDMGYNPIFAGGNNATTLHYVRNNKVLKAGELLLVDAAGEVDWYTADITQTFPVSKRFSPDQRKVYEKVLGVNRAITSMIKPGITYRELHHRSCELITDALLSLGVLTGSLNENIEQKTYRKYYMHGLGHFLGLDVHDAGIYDHRGSDVPLEAGMVMTNEPGLYFRDLKGPFGGIGVRIEDDILITANGSEVLTKELVRDADQIETLRVE